MARWREYYCNYTHVEVHNGLRCLLAQRFKEMGTDGVSVIAKGRGRKPSLPNGTVQAVVRDILHASLDDGSTHWTTRMMAERHGIGKDCVARIWRDHNLNPWNTDTFKISTDRDFESKLIDVVGLYMRPPERAVVLPSTKRPKYRPLIEHNQHSL